MAVQASEAITLRTYPLREADLIVSFFTRDRGKLRGTARGARKPKSPFGAGLQPLSVVRMMYSYRENRELLTLTGCDILSSPFDLLSDYGAGVAIGYMTEVSEQLLPPEEPNERFYRLLVAMLEHLRQHPVEGLWPVITYFSLWAVRLAGVLPEVRLEVESVAIAEEMISTPIAQLTPRVWNKETARDLRRLLVRQIEELIEKKLATVPLLESL